MLLGVAPHLVRCDDPTTMSMIKPEYLVSAYELPMLEQDPSPTIPDKDSETSYVFLQRFPLEGSPFYHTEIVACPRDKFTAVDQVTLDNHVASITGANVRPRLGSNKDSDSPGFVEIPESWWSSRDTPCVEMGYGGAPCFKRCCAVPHGKDQVPYPLNTRRAVISNADVQKKALFLYGTGPFSGEVAYQAVCNKANPNKCWSNWAGIDYRPIGNNCNTFTSTVLSCVYGLSEKKPHLGVSDMVTVTCNCPHESLTDLEDE